MKSQELSAKATRRNKRASNLYHRHSNLRTTTAHKTLLVRELLIIRPLLVRLPNKVSINILDRSRRPNSLKDHNKSILPRNRINKVEQAHISLLQVTPHLQLSHFNMGIANTRTKWAAKTRLEVTNPSWTESCSRWFQIIHKMGILD